MIQTHTPKHPHIRSSPYTNQNGHEQRFGHTQVSGDNSDVPRPRHDEESGAEQGRAGIIDRAVLLPQRALRLPGPRRRVRRSLPVLHNEGVVNVLFCITYGLKFYFWLLFVVHFYTYWYVHPCICATTPI